jgi:hypothetical protein
MAPSLLDLAWDAVAILKLFGEVQQYGTIDELKAQKLTFLLELFGQKAGLRAAHLRFYRYKYGPYSGSLIDLIEFLTAHGFVDRDTRHPTSRGLYLLEYALPEMTGVASDALSLTPRIAKDYGDYSGLEITRLVYATRVPVHGLGGKMMTVRKVRMGVDILNPTAVADLKEPVNVAGELLKDIRSELELTPEQLDPNNPAVRDIAMSGVKRALKELTH